MALTTPVPLTSIFSLPYTLSTSCFSQLYQDGTSAVILGPGSQCIPDGPPAVSSTLHTYYSPGLWDGRPACPDNWTPACTDTLTSGTVTETAVTCCPNANGLGLLSILHFSCQPVASLTISDNQFKFFNQFGCTMQMGALASAVDGLTVTNTYGSTPTVTVQDVDTHQGPNAYSVQVRWQQSDLQPVTTTPTSSAAQTSSSGAVSSSSSSSSNNGLSTGAKAAIGVVIPIVVVAAAIIGALIYRRKKKTTRTNQPVQNTYEQSKPELSGTSAFAQRETTIQPSELDGLRHSYRDLDPQELSASEWRRSGEQRRPA